MDGEFEKKMEELVALAKSQGYITYEEINEILPMTFDTPEVIDQVLIFLTGMDIQVLNQAEVDRQKERKKEAKELEGLAKRAEGSPDDPVRMYLKEMGSVPLLTREEEVEISKRIEKAQIQIKHIILRFRYSSKEAISIATFLLVGKDRFDKIISLPLQVVIWGVGIIYVADVVADHIGFDDFSKSMRTLRSAFIVGCVGWVALRWLKAAFAHLHQKSQTLGVAPGTIHALSKLSAFVVAIITLMLIFTVYGFNIMPLLAFGGIGMAGVAFAAQDIIGNFFGGAMLHFTRPFAVGDMVEIPSQQMFEGTVEEIGWYMTMIRSFDKEPVYFPNALFSKMNVVNRSRRTHRRIRETIGLRYEDMPKLKIILPELKKRILAYEKVDGNQVFNVVLNRYGDYGLEIYLHLLTTTTIYSDFLDVKQEVLMIAHDVIYTNGAEIAYPTSEVYLKGEAPSKERV